MEQTNLTRIYIVKFQILLECPISVFNLHFFTFNKNGICPCSLVKFQECMPFTKKLECAYGLQASMLFRM